MIVVIDGKPSAREQLVVLLRQALPDAEVVAVEDSFQGLIAIARADPDIVVTDVQVSRMDGIEMLRSLVRAPVRKPCTFVAVTDMSEPELAALGDLPDSVLLLEMPPYPNRFIAALQVQV